MLSHFLTFPTRKINAKEPLPQNKKKKTKAIHWNDKYRPNAIHSGRRPANPDELQRARVLLGWLLYGGERERRRSPLRLSSGLPGGRARCLGLRQRRPDLRQRVRAEALRLPVPDGRRAPGFRSLPRWVARRHEAHTPTQYARPLRRGWWRSEEGRKLRCIAERWGSSARLLGFLFFFVVVGGGGEGWESGWWWRGWICVEDNNDLSLCSFLWRKYFYDTWFATLLW